MTTGIPYARLQPDTLKERKTKNKEKKREWKKEGGKYKGTGTKYIPARILRIARGDQRGDKIPLSLGHNGCKRSFPIRQAKQKQTKTNKNNQKHKAPPRTGSRHSYHSNKERLAWAKDSSYIYCVSFPFFFPLVIPTYDKEVQPGLVGGEHVVGLFISSCFFLFFLVLPVAAPPCGHDSSFFFAVVSISRFCFLSFLIVHYWFMFSSLS